MNGYKLLSTRDMVRMYMNGDQVDQTLDAIRRTREYLSTGPNAREKSLRFLQDAGIVDASGNLTPHYRPLPTRSTSPGRRG